MTKYLNFLNKKQQDGLLCIDKPVLILAGAGTGKTRVLTYKISYLITESNVSYNRILAVTFTNKAAYEIKKRIIQILDLNIKLLNWDWIGTFHSICLKIILLHYEKINLKKNFTIYDKNESSQLIQSILKEYPSFKIHLNESSKNISNQLSKYKNYYPYNVEEHLKRENEALLNLHNLYEEKLIQNNAIDFDNLITKTLFIFKNYEKILEEYQLYFEYILVDEFQDINIPQYELIKLLTNKKKNTITVVGDDDQSIYSWRGADSSKMNAFLADYKNVFTIKLEQNYRSSNILLQAANSLISNNYSRIGKNLWSQDLKEENIPEYYELYNNQDEAIFIVDMIKKIKEKENIPLKNFCILYRTNRQSRILEEILIQKNIPYKIFGGLGFYERSEIKDLLSFFIYLINPSNFLSIKRIIEISQLGIGIKSLEKIERISLEKDLKIKDSINDCIKEKLFRKDIEKKIRNLLNFLDEIESLYRKNKTNLLNLLDEIIKYTNYMSYLKKKFPDENDRLSNVEEFRISIGNFQENYSDTTLVTYLQEISLNLENSQKRELKTDFISLMTLHNSKGLEFDYTFLCGLIEKILPHQMSIVEQNIEEERRLFYVGLTRTQKKCFLTSYIQEINPFHKISHTKSRFLEEINPAFIKKNTLKKDKYSYFGTSKISYETNEIKKSFYKKSLLIKKLLQKSEENSQEKNQILDIKEMKIGLVVKHKEYGICKVVDIKKKKYPSPVILVKLINGDTIISLFFNYNKFYYLT